MAEPRHEQHPPSERQMVKASIKTRAGPPDLRWVARYARHCGFEAAQHHADAALAQALRLAFGAPAWRILCRSPKACFLPILLNRELSIHSLIAYCRRLAEHSFVQAPQPVLLAYYVQQRRLYFNHPCRVPEDDDYQLIRIADRHPGVRMRDIERVSQWLHQSRVLISPKSRWIKLIERARLHHEQIRVLVASQKYRPWYFFCGPTDWRGYRILPLTDIASLWDEGYQLGTCLYKLRAECTQLQPSRFFSVQKAGKRVATLELTWRIPAEDFQGMDRTLGRWEMQDLRLAFNRIPDDALLQSMQAFASMYNHWSQRPRRMPPGHLVDLNKRITRVRVERADAASRGSSHPAWPPWGV